MNNVQKFRVWKGKTQKQLCKEAGICIQTLRRVEKGRHPSYLVAYKIAKYFDVSLEQLFPKPTCNYDCATCNHHMED